MNILNQQLRIKKQGAFFMQVFTTKGRINKG